MTECEAFTILFAALSKALYSLGDRGPIATFVREETLGTDILDMRFRCLSKQHIPSERTHRFSTVEELDRFSDSGSAFVGA